MQNKGNTVKNTGLGFLILITTIIAGTNLSAQDSTKNTIAILPISSSGIDSNYVHTAESILRVELNKLSSSTLISEKKTRAIAAANNCREIECAVAAGKILQAKLIAGCSLSALGGKIIVQYFLADVATGKEIIADQTTSLTVEDLEPVMKRIAKSIAEHTSVKEGAEVGNITAIEAEKPLRRSTYKNFGVSFGYLYPTSGYDNSTDKSFVLDLRWGYEILNDYAVGLLIGARDGFAINLFGDYLMTRTDVCPLIGASLGFHWVSHAESQAVYTTDPVTHTSYYSTTDQNLHGDGIELGVHAGVRLLRTFSFQILLQVDLIHTFNDYDDNAVVFTIGML